MLFTCFHISECVQAVNTGRQRWTGWSSIAGHLQYVLRSPKNFSRYSLILIEVILLYCGLLLPCHSGLVPLQLFLIWSHWLGFESMNKLSTGIYYGYGSLLQHAIDHNRWIACHIWLTFFFATVIVVVVSSLTLTTDMTLQHLERRYRSRVRHKSCSYELMLDKNEGGNGGAVRDIEWRISFRARCYTRKYVCPGVGDMQQPDLGLIAKFYWSMNQQNDALYALNERL